MIFRLPLGGTTEDSGEWVEAWAALGRRAEQFFEGYVAIAFDPMVRMDVAAQNKNSLQQTYFDLTPEAVMALRAPKGK